MKPRRVDLSGLCERRDVIDRVVETRKAEALQLASGLVLREKQALHDFRIACKRLRYALERFEDVEPSFKDFAGKLAQIQDALGEAHDRDELLSILPPTMGETERRLLAEREQLVDRATAIWKSLHE